MKKIFVALSMVAFLAACDDSSSASAGQNDDLGIESSSSSVTLQSSSSVRSSSSAPVEDLSSSSEKEKSSSSKGEKNAEESSSSVKSESSENLSSSNNNGEYSSLIDERDGRTYRIVKIGNQWWMAENLNYYDTLNLSVKAKSWCYNDSAYYCKKYGRLYTWAAAVDSVKLYRDKSIDCGYGRACVLSDTVYGICPLGWHLPNNMEWETLYSAVGGQSTAAKILRTTSGWLEGDNGTDSVGFSALPAGYMTSYDCKGHVGSIGCFGSEGYSAYFWSATENSVYEAYYMQFYYFLEGATGGFISKNYAHSIRCVKN